MNPGLAPADAPRCPPCTGNCNQGRDCPANVPEDDDSRPPLTLGAAWCAVGCVAGAWAFVVGLVALVRGCAS